MSEINTIQYKKPFYKIKAPLMQHLKNYSRVADLPIDYESLTEFVDLIPIFDKDGEPTLWYQPMYSHIDQDNINQALVRTYELLVADGNKVPYLGIERIEYCSFGNSKPFRIKVKNELNDNYDHFYVKKADASRVYGLELEEIFSPDKVSFLVDKDTLVEEHIVGIPCDEFILKNDKVKIENRLRFVKEFVKFNERCFSRLLGDMRAYNFVVEITPDFDNVQYRLRPIDFDQQCYEGRKSIYLPQYYKDNIALVNLGIELLNKETVNQYVREEQAAMRKRYTSSKHRTKSLITKMIKDNISTPENIKQLANDLSKHHNYKPLKDLTTMGEILATHLELSLNISIIN